MSGNVITVVSPTVEQPFANTDTFIVYTNIPKTISVGDITGDVNVDVASSSSVE